MTIFELKRVRSSGEQYNFLIYNYFPMAEPEILSDFNDQKLNQTTSGQIDKLPKIQQPRTRQQTRSKAEQRKTPTLPLIKNGSLQPSQNQTASIKSMSMPQGDDFAMEIQQKLKMVLENVNHGEIEEDSDDSSQVEFEDLIEHNKQILKNQKQRNSNNVNIQNRPQKKQNKRKSKTMKPHMKNDNNAYEKRMKEYRDGIAENKYLQKKKQILVQRQETIEKAQEKYKNKLAQKDSPVRESQKQMRQNAKQTPPYNYRSNKSVPKPHPPSSAFIQKKSSNNIRKVDARPSKVTSQESKSANLFDNIHNLLLNPQKNRSTSEVKRNPSSTIKFLEDKIKSINQKLGVKECNQEKQRINELGQKTALDWKRVQYDSARNFRCHYDSNFEKELDKIGQLQQKGNDYLSKLINHQKILVELALIKKDKKQLSQNTN